MLCVHTGENLLTLSSCASVVNGPVTFSFPQAGVPLLPLLGDAATASRYLRLLAAVTAAALLARRALRQRQQAAADQGALQVGLRRWTVPRLPS